MIWPSPTWPSRSRCRWPRFQHLTILTRAYLIAQEKRGRVKWCKLEPDAMRTASIWMQGFGQFEPVNLEAFERFLAIELDNDAQLDPSER